MKTNIRNRKINRAVENAFNECFMLFLIVSLFIIYYTFLK